jgi:hypothetical protein
MSVTQGLSEARPSYRPWPSPAVGGLFSLATRELFRLEELGLGKPRKECVTIGASRKCDIVLGDPCVSSLHAAVTHCHDALCIVDLVSRNGVFLVERRRTRKIYCTGLALGQRFVLGRTTLVCVTEDGHAPLTAFDADELAGLSRDIAADRQSRRPPPRGILHGLRRWVSGRSRST